MARPTGIETEASTLRTCCELIAKHGKLGIVDLASLTSIREPTIRAAVRRALELGYLREDPKQDGIGKGNRKKSFLRTRKKLPGIISEPPAPKPRGPGPFRHPFDEWLFGPAPTIESSAARTESRVFVQPMTVTDDEVELA